MDVQLRSSPVYQTLDAHRLWSSLCRPYHSHTCREQNRLRQHIFDSYYRSRKTIRWVDWAHLPAKYCTYLTSGSGACIGSLLGTCITQFNHSTDSFQHYLRTCHLGLQLSWERLLSPWPPASHVPVTIDKSRMGVGQTKQEARTAFPFLLSPSTPSPGITLGEEELLRALAMLDNRFSSPLQKRTFKLSRAVIFNGQRVFMFYTTQ